MMKERRAEADKRDEVLVPVSLPFVPRVTSRSWLLLCLSLLTLHAVAQAQTQATITASPAVISFTFQVGSSTLPVDQKIALKSSAPNTTATFIITGDPQTQGNWLTSKIPTSTSFALPATIGLSATPTGLAAGVYPATITVTSITPGGNVITPITVTLTVTPPASKLYVSPASLPVFTYTTGALATVPAQQTFVVFSDLSPVAGTITVSGGSWLLVTPKGSYAPSGLSQTITLTVDPLQLAVLTPNTYTASITITAPTATNKTTIYPIALQVNAAPPTIGSIWPTGVVMNTQSSGTTAVVVNGTNYFATSTVNPTGFISSSLVTVTDSSAGAALTASQTFTIPVYYNDAATATVLRFMMGSPLPSGFVGGIPYFQDLSPYIAGGTPPYRWQASALPPASGLGLTVTGQLSGLAPAAGDYLTTITVTDKNGLTVSMPFEVTVYPGVVPVVGSLWFPIVSITPSGSVGAPYTATSLGVMGGTGPYTFLPDTYFPTGLSITASVATGTISGLPMLPSQVFTTTNKGPDAAQVIVPNAYIAKLGTLLMAVKTPKPGGGVSNSVALVVYGPGPRILSVVNSASYAGGTVAPGELITLFGTGLGPTNLALYDPNFIVQNPGIANLPQSLPLSALPGAGTSVQFATPGGVFNAPLVYASATQIGAMVPFEIAASITQLSVNYAGVLSSAYVLKVQPNLPGIFSADGSGLGQGAILNVVTNASGSSDYTINSGANPAVKGSTIVLYLTGFGTTNPLSTTYIAAPVSPQVDTATPVSVTIGGQPAVSVSAVPGNSFPGVLQVNVTVPTGAPSGKTVAVTASVGGTPAQDGITMSVK